MFNPNQQYQMMPQFNQNQFQPQIQPQFGYPQQSIQSTPYQQQTAYPTQGNRPQSLHGRVVNSVEEIMPNEVVMDGSVSLFPTRDFSRIYAKAWNSDGTITTIEFTPTLTTSISATENDEIKQVVERCDVLLTKVDELLSQLRAD